MVNIKDTAPESEEQKFKQKCNELRKRIAEVEESNEISTLALSRTRYSIRRLRLEYSILLERLESRLSSKEIGELPGFTGSEFRKPLLLNEALDTKFQCIEKYKSVKPKDTPVFNSSKKEMRDPNMPKRPTNAYLMFCERERENIRADIESKNPGQPIIDFPKILTEIWRGMNERERMPYWKLFLEDRERYQSEMQIYSNKKRNHDELSDVNVNDSSVKLDDDEARIGYNDFRSEAGSYHDSRTLNEGVVTGNEEKTNNPGVVVDINGAMIEDLNKQDEKETQGNQRSQVINISEQRDPHVEVSQETVQENSGNALSHERILDTDGAVGKNPLEQ